MYKELEHKDDQSLLNIYTADPASVEGKAADAFLRYRQYKVTKAHNKWLIALTMVLAISAIAESLAALKSLTDVPGKPSIAEGAIANQTLSADPAESEKFKELIDRVQKIEHRLNSEDTAAPPPKKSRRK